ncbi:MarR family transcriptional regulator [Amycolatopsis sp. NBC_01488]|uniref:MarR family transcriptional regulator n=1 Tax=Amycolatopsis sp. NBC_01488 TaxID=2903563 RepID=UPI003FA47232
MNWLSRSWSSSTRDTSGSPGATTFTRVQVLGTVAARRPVRRGTIAAELGLTASATSRHLAALERAEQVTVSPDPDDSHTSSWRPSSVRAPASGSGCRCRCRCRIRIERYSR